MMDVSVTVRLPLVLSDRWWMPVLGHPEFILIDDGCQLGYPEFFLTDDGCQCSATASSV